MRRLDERIAAYDDHIRLIARAEPRSQQLMTIPGVGATTASALLAHIGHGHDFAGGRELVAWLGLAPSQYSWAARPDSVASPRPATATCAVC